MTYSEQSVTSILDPIIESVLMRNDVAIGAAEGQLRQVAGIAEDDDPADLALYNLADAGNAALNEACQSAFFAGCAYGRGVNVAAGELATNKD
jgi:hypothetical protein